LVQQRFFIKEYTSKKMFTDTFTVLYGAQDSYLDVTKAVLENCVYNDKIYIPSDDTSRSEIFGDPMFGVLKHIKIIHQKEYVFEVDIEIIFTQDGPMYPEEELAKIHSSLNFTGGSLQDEYPEQLMAMMFIQKDAKVLELGSNIGRNTLIIGSILDDPKNFVTVECDANTCRILKKNLEFNDLPIHVVEAAVSKRRLFQVGWNTYTEENAPSNAVEVNTISFSQIQQQYQLEFDTLVADCEGALYYILQDEPDMLDKMKLIIVENDYNDLSHKQAVDDIVVNKGFKRIYVKRGPWGPCAPNFYEVWVK